MTETRDTFKTGIWGGSRGGQDMMVVSTQRIRLGDQSWKCLIAWCGAKIWTYVYLIADLLVILQHHTASHNPAMQMKRIKHRAWHQPQPPTVYPEDGYRTQEHTRPLLRKLKAWLLKMIPQGLGHPAVHLGYWRSCSSKGAPTVYYTQGGEL